jgi:hypothetical protein
VRVFALTLLLAVPAFAGGKQLTLIFQGDNGGEVAPCG